MKDEIAIEYGYLADGEKARGVCPRCRGGSSGEKSLQVSRKGGKLYYHCYRATCGHKSYTKSRRHSSSAPQKKAYTPFTHPIQPLSDVQLDFMSALFGFNELELQRERVSWCPDLQRVVYTRFSVEGDTIGHIARYYPHLTSRKLSPKTVNYYSRSPDDIKLPIHFPRGSQSHSKRSLVLVEDIPSAIKVSRIQACAALCGTYFPAHHAALLSKAGVRNLIIWLDSDVVRKSWKFAREYTCFFDSIEVIVTERDPKDLGYGEIVKQLERAVK